MKKITKNEESFVFAIHNKRHDTNEILLALPFILALGFAIIGAPIIYALCDLALLWLPVLIAGPFVCFLIFYFIRKKIVFNGFFKVWDVSDKVELTEIQSDALEAADSGKVFMFPYSESMKVILYNWFCSMNVTKEGKLKMYKVFYDNYAPVYLAVCEKDLNISDEDRQNFAKETVNCLRLSDMINGKVVNTKLYSRLTNKQ